MPSEPQLTMDIGDSHTGHGLNEHLEEEIEDGAPKLPRVLPPDLPTSLDDRKRAPEYASETEMYDGWQGLRIFTLLLTGLTMEKIFV